MELSESIWGCYVIDSNQLVVAFKNHDKRLLFDNEIVIGRSFTDIVDVQKYDGFQIVIDAVRRAVKYHRSICQEYTSLYGDGQRVCVGLFGEWDEEGNLKIYLNPMDKLEVTVNVESESRRSRLINSVTQYHKLFQVLRKKVDAAIWSVELDNNDILRDSDGIFVDILNIDNILEFKPIHPDDKQVVLASMMRAFSDGLNVWRIELRIDINSDGIYKWCEATGIIEYVKRNGKSYTQIFGISRSIESHKQYEKTLLETQKKLNKQVYHNSLILNNINTGLVFVDAEYNVRWNNIDTRLTRLACGAFEVGTKCYKSAHNYDAPCKDCILCKAQLSRKIESRQVIFDDGVVLDIYISPVFQANGQLEGAVMRLDDVTNKEDMIKELQAVRFNAEESERLKTAFLANMSHEIRTPLNAIIGFSELIAGATTEESKEYSQIISTNSDLLLTLINNILNFSKIEAGTVEIKYEKINISDYFNEVITSLASSIDSTRVRLVLENKCGDDLVNMDGRCITMLLTNYLTNAIKYTANGLITVGCSYENNGVYLYVKDTGIGIAQDKKELVFNRFEKIDEFAQGTGLGLSISKGIIEAMNGQLGFESTKNVGSLFWALIPFEENSVN